MAVFQALNKLPEAQHGTDIMRVREPLLAGQGALYRQSIVMSSLASAEMNALLNRTCANWAGKIKLKVTHQVSSKAHSFTEVDPLLAASPFKPCLHLMAAEAPLPAQSL